MKFLIIGLCFLVSGCSTHQYVKCIEVQKSISKDMVVMEAARINALIEMTKSADPAVKATAIMQLQRNDVKTVTMNCPN